VEGLLKPMDDGKASECEAPSREATPAWPVEGLLKPMDDRSMSAFAFQPSIVHHPSTMSFEGV
jgi:hypothetical protein